MKTFIFDMDGTLFQTDKILEASLEDTFKFLRGQGLWDGPAPLETYRTIMGVPLPTVWETLLPEHTLEIRQQANSLFHDNLISNINEGKGELYPHVIELFSCLKEENCRIYIASNGQIGYLEAILAYYGLYEWVTEVWSIQQIDSQNKSDLVSEIVRKHQITEGAVIGDRLSDFRAAKDNGLLSIGCRFDFAHDDELEHADIIIGSLLEIKKLVRQGITESFMTKISSLEE